MSKLGDRRRSYKKEQDKLKKQEHKEATRDLKIEARKLVKELSPEHFLYVKEIEERLIKEGHFTVPEEYFHIRDNNWLLRAHKLHKEYEPLRGMLIEEKSNILSLDIRLEPEYFLVKEEYLVDEVVRYLGKKDVALLDTGWGKEHRYKLFIIE